MAFNPSAQIKIISTDRIGQDRIDNFIRRGFHVGINLSAEQMADSFRNSEISIVSASGVAIEALSQNSSVVAGYYVPNQVNIYNALKSEGYIWPLDNFFDAKVLQRLEEAITSVKSGAHKRKYEQGNTIQQYQKLFYSI